MHYRKPRPLGARYWRLWGGVVTSSLGTGILIVAFPLLALQFTHNPLAISGVLVAAQAPALITALPFGTLADRLNRRRLIIAIQLFRFAVLGAFGVAIIAHRDSLLLIYLTTFLLGGMTVAFDVVANAALPSIVDQENLVRANAHLLNAELTSENLLGQALGGAALAVTQSLPFLAEAGSLIVSAALLDKAVPNRSPEPSESAAWQDLRDGLRWFLGHSFFRLQVAIMGCLAFGQGMVLGLLALYARYNLHLSNAGYGLLLALATAGTVLGGIWIARVDDRVDSSVTMVLAAIVMAAGYPILAVTHSAIVACGALIAEEAGVIIASTASRSLRQRLAAPEMQGRAASANTMVLMSSLPLGALAGGLIGRATSVSTTFLCTAALELAFLAFAGPRLIRQRHMAFRNGDAGPLPLVELKADAGPLPMVDISDRGVTGLDSASATAQVQFDGMLHRNHSAHATNPPNPLL